MSTPETPASTIPEDVVLLADQLRIAIARMNRRLRAQTPGGVTPAQLTVLLILDRHGEQTLSQLAERELVSLPSMNRTVSQLVVQGFVSRTPSPTDRRVALLQITDAGRLEAERTRRHRDQWLASRLLELSESERAQLGRVAELFNGMGCR